MPGHQLERTLLILTGDTGQGGELEAGTATPRKSHMGLDCEKTGGQ